MRIIAGQRRGHKFDGPRAKSAMRPTSDMVRESLFNMVGDLMPGRVAVDLFAGTGAIGLEALSRGAERAIFVEKDREHVGLIHRNVATLRYEGHATIRLADAYRWARTYRPDGASPLAVFLDPPYRDYETRRPALRQLLGGLVARLPAGSLITVEAGRHLDEVVADVASWDVRRYGDTQIAIRLVGEGDRGADELSAEAEEGEGLAIEGGAEGEAGDD